MRSRFFSIYTVYTPYSVLRTLLHLPPKRGGGEPIVGLPGALLEKMQGDDEWIWAVVSPGGTARQPAAPGGWWAKVAAMGRL
ncbi:hypothetical protein DHEL01_v209952 [Diaporthe helianthi]|uniref:Uncharacterized protein n=1 Tax=Diaporthe helianthi TaxID=158607 RepID=A0A2P5HN44_DIAHE|nr:hypothetical protein DHEL01_v209952 [Diaporthe helianthi]